MDEEAKRLLKERYLTCCVGLGIVVAAISPIAERTDFHRLLMGIAVGAFLVNLAAFMWAVTPTNAIKDDSCEFRVFKSVFYSTGIVCPYTVVCVLLPETFAPYLVLMIIPLICVVTTLYNFFPILISGLKWVCKKAVKGWRWIGSKFTRDGQVLPIINAAPRLSST